MIFFCLGVIGIPGRLTPEKFSGASELYKGVQFLRGLADAEHAGRSESSLFGEIIIWPLPIHGFHFCGLGFYQRVWMGFDRSENFF